MNALEFPFALFAFFAFVALVPPIYWFLGEYAPRLPAESQFLATLVMPMVVLLFISGWVEPG